MCTATYLFRMRVWSGVSVATRATALNLTKARMTQDETNTVLIRAHLPSCVTCQPSHRLVMCCMSCRGVMKTRKVSKKSVTNVASATEALQGVYD